MPRLDAPLPGMEPPYVRVDVTLTPEGTRTVRVFAAEGPGFVSAQESDLYEDLTAYEALDVAVAALSILLGC